MFEFFEKITPENAEKISEARADRIKTSVLSRIDFDNSDKEERPMNKHIKIKPLIIAAAVATTGLTTLASANTVDGGAFVADEYYGESAEPRIEVTVTELTDENSSENIDAIDGWQIKSITIDDPEIQATLISDKVGVEFMPLTDEAVIYEEQIEQDGDMICKIVTMRHEDGSLYGRYRLYYIPLIKE